MVIIITDTLCYVMHLHHTRPSVQVRVWQPLVSHKFSTEMRYENQTFSSIVRRVEKATSI